MTAATWALAVLAAASACRAVLDAGHRAAAAARLHGGRPSLATVVLAVGGFVRRIRPSSAGRDVDALADAVDAMAAALRAGAPPAEAIRAGGRGAPAPLDAALRSVAVAVDRGMPLRTAVDRWADAAGTDGPRLVAAAIAVHAHAGGDPGRALAGVADTLRERRALRREVRALSSQARMSAAVIAVAPAAFGVLAVGTDRATAAFLLGTPPGLVCLVAGLGLEVAGWRWMDRITRSVT